MDARSVISNEDDDRRSVASTTATTASLASRIQSLAVDFGPKLHSEHISEGFTEEEHQEDEETDHENEEVIEIPEEQLLQELDRLEPAFQVFHSCVSLASAEQRCWSFDLLTWYGGPGLLPPLQGLHEQRCGAEAHHV